MTPIPELEQAAKLLGEAADALLADDWQHAGQLTVAADQPVISAYTAFITGSVNPIVHWQLSMPVAAGVTNSLQRMPSRATEYAIYARDGWRCRYCGIRVIDRASRKHLNTRLPQAARWGVKNVEKHAALAALSASLDHVLPHSRGGTNDVANLVTACNACQFGRGQWTLAEVGFFDPRLFDPAPDSWDGLTRLIRSTFIKPDTQE